MSKYVLFAFNGNIMCFTHVLLNALDMVEHGIDAKIVIEGEAVKLVKELETSANPLYRKAKALSLFDSICKACSASMGVLEYNETVGIPLRGDMNGHPSMAAFIKAGYQVITL